MPHGLPAYLALLKYCWLGDLMRGVPWLFQWCQVFHFIGMSMLIGTIGVIDLRVLGVARGIPIGPIHRLLPWAFVGFGINAATGICFLSSEPGSYVYIRDFQIKMILIAVAGLNALWFRLAIGHKVAEMGAHMEAPALAKVICGLSLLLWVSVIVAGRFITYFAAAATL